MKEPVHVYECNSCEVTFAVEQAFEDQSCIVCPVCQIDDDLIDAGQGVLTVES